MQTGVFSGEATEESGEKLPGGRYANRYETKYNIYENLCFFYIFFLLSFEIFLLK